MNFCTAFITISSSIYFLKQFKQVGKREVILNNLRNRFTFKQYCLSV